jgi:hypothetical protein
LADLEGLGRAMLRLIVKEAQGVSGEPVPLGLALHGPAEDASVIITGLLPGMSLSTGDPFGGVRAGFFLCAVSATTRANPSPGSQAQLWLCARVAS